MTTMILCTYTGKVNRDAEHIGNNWILLTLPSGPKVWADNADAISMGYSGTGALKTDYTR